MSKTNFGVSLRLRGVQVIKYIPYTPPSPFEKEEDGFTVDQAPAVEHEDNPFARPVEEDDEEEEEELLLDDYLETLLSLGLEEDCWRKDNERSI